MRVRSEKAGRLFWGREQMQVLGYPCWGKGAAARVDTCLQNKVLC